MSFGWVLFVFVNAFWIALIIALPFGREEGESSEVAYKAAPATFNWRRSLKIAGLISVIFTVLLALVINSGVFVLDDW